MRISIERVRYQSNYDYYLLLITYYLLLITYYLLPITYYLLLITYYFFYNMWEMLILQSVYFFSHLFG